MSTWQPIETAPKDRTFILGHRPGRLPIALHWSHDKWRSNGGEAHDPTHWMPLPAPPSHIERIAGVAFLMQGGKVMLSLPKPNRHHDIIQSCSERGVPHDVIANANQGFYTSTGRYVTREEAVPIAAAAGQIIQKTSPRRMLFSEDVW